MSAKIKPENDDKINDELAKTVNNSPENDLADKQALIAKVAALEAQILKMENQQKQRLLAERLNTLKEQQIINEDYKRYAKQQLLEQTILPLLTNFEMALNYQTDDKNVKNFLNGFTYMFKNLKSALEKEGLTEIKITPGQIFDSTIAEAVEVEEVEALATNQKNNMIISVLASGYQLHNRVIIPVKVKIIKLKTIN